jgi:hypothetical protein
MESNLNIEDIFKGILTGFFASYLIILGMRPAAIYPDNILDIIDNPWIFLILFIINYYILYWDTTVALLLFLTLIALILDIVIFTDGDFIKDNMGIENMSGATTSGTSGATIANTDKSYKDINDIILERLIHFNKSSNGFL